MTFGKRYVKLVSWHIVETENGLIVETLCGRLPRPTARRADVIPGNAPTCESCLRIDERRERPNVDNQEVVEP